VAGIEALFGHVSRTCCGAGQSSHSSSNPTSSTIHLELSYPFSPSKVLNSSRYHLFSSINGCVDLSVKTHRTFSLFHLPPSFPVFLWNFRLGSRPPLPGFLRRHEKTTPFAFKVFSCSGIFWIGIRFCAKFLSLCLVVYPPSPQFSRFSQAISFSQDPVAEPPFLRAENPRTDCLFFPSKILFSKLFLLL